MPQNSQARTALLHIALGQDVPYTVATDCHNCGCEPTANDKQAALWTRTRVAAFFWRKKKDEPMENRRKGIPCNWTYDAEALEILKVLCPRGKSYGQYVSRLLIEEERRLHEQRRLREQRLDVFEELAAP